MTWTGYALLGLTAIVAMLVAVLMFATLRFAAAARESRRKSADDAGMAMLSAALEDAIGRLKAQERATAARADASEALSSQIVTSLASGLIVVDSAGRVQTANPSARRLLVPAALGHVSDQAILDQAPALKDVIDEVLRTREPVRRRTVSLTRPQGPMHLGVTVSSLTGGTTAGAICLFTDLTSALAREEQLRLKEALAQLGELSAGLAHEFRNGLSTIHGYARLLDPNALPAPQRQYVEGLRHETAALGEVVTNFLKFARPEPIGLTRCDLAAIVERAIEDVPSVSATCAGEFGAVEADDVLLRQALSNLLRNSVDACAAAGVPPQVQVTGHVDRHQREVIVCVSDNGPGIRSEVRARVFQPFFTTKSGGTGLGLAIVQKIVVSHNGRITAENAPDGGARFTINLPLVD